MLRLGSIARVDPPPLERVRFDYNPEQYIRQLGVGGHEERRHPRARSTTEWTGTPLHRVSLDLFFDALRRRQARTDIEVVLQRLHRWGLPADPADPISEPPRLQVEYGHGQQLRWVIQDINYRSVLLDPDTGRRVQASLTVDLLEHRSTVLALTPVEAAQAQAAAAAATTGTPTPATAAAATSRTYTVVSGDTLSTIAARQLGNMARWTEIYALNQPTPISNPDVIQAGWVLALPAA